MPTNPYAELQQPVMQVSPHDCLTFEDLYTSVCIIGATGSGKTSSAAQLAFSLLRAGFGGIVLTAKPGERQEWERYAAATGRSKDVVIFSPGGGAAFNFLEYEMTRTGPGARDSANITDLFYAVLEAAGRQTSGGNDAAFWENALRQLIQNAVDLCFFARDAVRLIDIKNIISSTATNRTEVHDPAWQSESFCYKLIEEGEKRERTEDEQYDFNECVSYFLEEFPALSDKTRSIIITMFSSMAAYFLRGKLRRMFCDTLTIQPEDTWERGKIIILDVPVKEFQNRGKFAQVLFKHVYQRAVERRDVRQHPRACFIWADEAQHLVTAYDAQFVSTSRSSRVCSVYLSQSLPVYYSAFGSSPERARFDALALLGNMQLKFLHSQTEQETCEWMSNLVGKVWTTKTSTNFNGSYLDTMSALTGNSDQSGSSIGTTEVLDHIILPAEWQRFRTGGFRHQGLVDVVLHQGGREFSTGENYLRVTFRQEGF